MAQGQLSVTCPPDLFERLRNAAVALAAEGASVSGITRDALVRELTRLEKKHNRGRPFPKRKRAPKPGRPILA